MSRTDLLARSAGVRLVGKDRRCRPGESRARQTIKRLAIKHGDDHVRLVLRLIVESRNNRSELHAETIMAMSAVVLANPEWTGRSGLLDAMDRVELAAIRQRARRSPYARAREIIAILVDLELRIILDPEPQGSLL